MEEQLIKFETAKLAKEKGFNWPVTNMFKIGVISKGVIEEDNPYDNVNKLKGSAVWSRPTQTLLQKWLREEYNCIVEVVMHSDHESKPINEFRSKADFLYAVEVNYYGKNFEVHQREYSDFFKTHFDSYEKALEVGLFEGLKLI